METYGYEMEELVFIVAKLSKSYLGCDSTSMTYECANQLMEGVIYSIGECFEQKHAVASMEKVTAMEAYEQGQQFIQQKMKKLVHLYNEEIEVFDDYGLRCLGDTVKKGIPAFIRNYDAKYFPQETHLTLDYPVKIDYTKDFCEKTGIDRVLPYIECIFNEQHFLQRFPRQDIIERLRNYHKSYTDLFENLIDMI